MILFRFIFLSILFCLFGGRNNQIEQKRLLDQNLNFKSQPQRYSFNKDSLNGVWAKDQNENALFEIIGDSIYYVEHDHSYFLKLREDTLFLYLDNGYIVKLKLIKATGDSLVYEHDDGDITRLYKRQ